jgi:general L-amino acid transport system substrate-binding protein
MFLVRLWLPKFASRTPSSAGEFRNRRAGVGLTLAPIVAGLTIAGVTAAACHRQPAKPAAPPPAEAQAAPPASATLDRVRARKRLKCGVTDNLPGFAERGLTGWRGFDVDLCRAVAAATLGDSRAVSITGLSNKTRFAALESGTVDLVAGGGTVTFTHDVALNIDFVGVSFFDSQGFLTSAPRPPRRGQPPPPPKTIADLNGQRICVQGGSPAQQALALGLKARGLSYQPIVKDDRQQALEAYQKHECDAVTDDLSVLAYDLASLHEPDRHVLLAETLSDDPVGPMVREGDDRWANVVRWTLNALVLAEAAKVDSRTVDQARKDSVDPQLRRLLGLEGDAGRRLGLADDWAYKAIREVGSYGEIFDRNLGPATPLKLERGRNALWTADKPGQIYAPPLR